MAGTCHHACVMLPHEKRENQTYDLPKSRLSPLLLFNCLLFLPCVSGTKAPVFMEREALLCGKHRHEAFEEQLVEVCVHCSSRFSCLTFLLCLSPQELRAAVT